MKSGDRVWIPGTIHAEVAGRTQPIYEVDALGDVPADRVLPDSPALPRVARWLSDWADELTLWPLIREAAAKEIAFRDNDALVMLDALLAALEGS